MTPPKNHTATFHVWICYITQDNLESDFCQQENNHWHKRHWRHSITRGRSLTYKRSPLSWPTHTYTDNSIEHTSLILRAKEALAWRRLRGESKRVAGFPKHRRHLQTTSLLQDKRHMTQSYKGLIFFNINIQLYTMRISQKKWFYTYISHGTNRYVSSRGKDRALLNLATCSALHA